MGENGPMEDQDQPTGEDRRGMLDPRIAAAGEGAGPPGRDDARRGGRLPDQAAPCGRPGPAGSSSPSSARETFRLDGRDLRL
jgi:hypothetical protein